MATSGVGRLSWTFTEPFGAAVTIDDLRAPLSEAEQAALKTLFYERHFLEFRDQNLARDDLRRLGGYLGPLPPADDEPAPILAPDPKDGAFGTPQLWFHRDLVYAPQPFQVIGLHALDVEPGQTSTHYASGAHAWRALPAPLKARIHDMKAISALGRLSTQRVTPADVTGPQWPQTVHPLVASHPVTGIPVLLICQLMTLRIIGLELAESDDLLDELLAYVTAPDNIHTHRWRNGDIFIWDNFAGVHARDSLAGVTRRKLQRVTVGELSFRQAFPDFDLRKHTEGNQGAGYQGPHSKY